MSTVFTRLLDFIKSHKVTAAFYLFFAVFWAVTLPCMAYLFGHIVDEIKVHGVENVATFSLVAVPLMLYVTIHVLRSFGYYTNGILSLWSIPLYKKKMVASIFEHLATQSIDYFESRKSGSLSNKVTNACIGLEPIIYNLFNSIIPQSLAIFITGIMLSMVVPYFGLVFWLWGVSIIIYTYKTAKIGQKNSEAFASACSTFNGNVVDYITNIQSVIFSASSYKENKKLAHNMDELIASERRRNKHANTVLLIQHLAMNLLVAFFLIGSVLGFEKGLVSIGEVVFVMTSVTAIAGLTSGLGNSFLELMYNLGLLKEALSLLNDEPDVPELTNASAHNIKNGEVEFKQVSFSYPTSATIFENFDLKIKAKEKVGIVGRSGEGKTTLIKLLLRLYDVSEGEVRIDNTPVKSYLKSSLRSQISVVPQQVTLFHRSIAENISYGCGEKTMDEIRAASKLARSDEFIEKLENGYETVVGEQGVKLSGGQRQRLIIARAILKNAPILLLDEATSALDSDTEEKIQNSLEALLIDKTAVIVAHRLSTLKMMDRIVVLEGGRVVEEGTHDELLAHKGPYFLYWQKQSSKENHS